MKEKKDITLPHTLKLKRPVRLGTTEVTEIIFKYEPTAESLDEFPLVAEMQTLKHFRPVISSMIDDSSEVLCRMNPVDYARCLEIANFFMGDLGIGATPLE